MSIAEKLQIIAENEQRVYTKGKSDGYTDGYESGSVEGYTNGYNQGYEDGKAEGGGGGGLDEFWNAYQEGGNRVNYRRAFAAQGWTDTTFKPKYDIRPTNASDMFNECQITDLKGICDSRGVVLDFSKATMASYPFSNSRITRMGVVDFSSAANISTAFNACISLVSVDRFIFGSKQLTDTSFSACQSLEHIIFDGVISNSVNLKVLTKLDAESIGSIMDALSTTVSGMPTVTLSLVAVDKAFETSEGANDGRYSDAWYELYYAHNDKWSISLL